MDYVNIDLLDGDKNFKLVKTDSNQMFEDETKKFKEGEEVYKSKDGIVVAKEMKIEPVKPKDAKVYKLYQVEANDTLKTVVNRFFDEFPNTKKYYTESQLCNEIISTNGLRNNPKSLAGLNFLTIPAYISVDKKEEINLDDLPEYDEHFVTLYERAYYQIVINLNYTTDQDEILRLSQLLRDLNGNDKPEIFSIIKVPNVQRYKLEKLLDEEQQKKR